MIKNTELLNSIKNKFSEEDFEKATQNHLLELLDTVIPILTVGIERHIELNQLNHPDLLDLTKDDISLLTLGCEQLSLGYGILEEYPISKIDVSGFYALMKLLGLEFISRKTKYKWEFNSQRGILDMMTIINPKTASTFIIYNFCMYNSV